MIAATDRPAGPLAGPQLALLVALVAAFFFAADLAAWHVGIHMTKLGNATLFGNVVELRLCRLGACGWRVAGPSPIAGDRTGAGRARRGAADGQQLRARPRNFAGDLLALFAGLLYTGYLIAVQRARGSLKPLPLLFLAERCSERRCCCPCRCCSASNSSRHDWTFVLLLALGSQVIGQGLLVYGIGYAAAADRRPGAADPAGDLGLRRLDGLWRDACRRSTGSARPRSPLRWSSCACPTRGLRSAGRAAQLSAVDERRVPLERLRRELALAVGENAVFDGWTAQGGRFRRRSSSGSIRSRRGWRCPRARRR